MSRSSYNGPSLYEIKCENGEIEEEEDWQCQAIDCGNFYTVGYYKYDNSFSKDWALSHFPGTGPEQCENCYEHGNVNHMFCAYCVNCAETVYKGQRGPGKAEPTKPVDSDADRRTQFLECAHDLDFVFQVANGKIEADEPRVLEFFDIKPLSIVESVKATEDQKSMSTVIRESAVNRLFHILTIEKIFRCDYWSLPRGSALGEIAIAFIASRSRWGVQAALFDMNPHCDDQVRIDYAMQNQDGETSEEIVTPLWTNAVAAGLMELLKFYQKTPDTHEKVVAHMDEKLQTYESENFVARFQEVIHISEQLRDMAAWCIQADPETLVPCATAVRLEDVMEEIPFYRDAAYKFTGSFVMFKILKKEC